VLFRSQLRFVESVIACCCADYHTSVRHRSQPEAGRPVGLGRDIVTPRMQVNAYLRKGFVSVVPPKPEGSHRKKRITDRPRWATFATSWGRRSA
jgi:hypothetical protein